MSNTVTYTRKGDTVEVTLMDSVGKRFLGTINNQFVDIDAVESQLRDHRYRSSREDSENATVITEGGVRIRLTLHPTGSEEIEWLSRQVADLTATVQALTSRLEVTHTLSRQWKNVGTLADFERIRTEFPQTQFEFGLAYNGGPYPARVWTWNHGIRITYESFYPQGDNGATLLLGNSVFTKGTDDADSKDHWYHRYVNIPTGSEAIMTPRGGNGISDGVQLFVRPL